jgi:hypothetical protein
MTLRDQVQALKLLGQSNAQIGQALGVSEGTVRYHLPTAATPKGLSPSCYESPRSWRRRKHPTMWSFVMPTACMNA